MVLDGHVVGFLQASHHVGLLTFRHVTTKSCELLDHNAVLKQLVGLHANSLVLDTIQSHSGILVMDFCNDMVPLNLGLVCQQQAE